MDWIIVSGLLLTAFLCGSIPTGYLVVKKTRGVDIRKVGSGNIGSTNVKRIAGAKAAKITQVIDILKGVIPVAVVILLDKVIQLPLDSNILAPLAGLAAIIGHDFTPFLSFKGGKGVNTTIGAFVLVAPLPTLISVIIYFVLKMLTGIVSVGSVALGIALPVSIVFFKMPAAVIVCSIIAGVLIVTLHRENISRLLRGEEKPVS